MTPLRGLIVAEHGEGVGIRFAGCLLAQLGAEVTRPGAPKAGAHDAWLDQGKAFGDGPPPALRLIEGAAAAPDDGALTARLHWFDPAGPWADWRGGDAVISAAAGLAWSFGPAEGPPTLAQSHGPQVIAGATLCAAALAGLIGRRRGAGPADVATSVHEAALCLSEISPIGFSQGGPAGRRIGVNRYAPTYPCTVWPTAEGWLGVTALTPPQWRALCDLAGAPELADDPRFASADLRLEAADEVDARLAPAFLTRPAAVWAAEGQARRIPLTEVPAPGALPCDPHWRARGSFAALPAPHEALVGPRAPARIAQGAPFTRPEGAPLPGLPLAGIRVLDLSMGWAGPLATRMLGDLGADVVKVESAAHMDWWRGWDGPEAGDPPPSELRPGFNALNRNKRGVLIDLTVPEGLAQAHTLAAGADLVIDNQATGVMARFGLGHDGLAALAPGVVSMSMGAFGAFGPKAGWRAYGSTSDQAASLPLINGEPDWPPSLQHVAYGDAVAGVFAAALSLAGLWGRTRHGGAAIDLSQVECLFQIAAPAILAEQETRRPVPRLGSGRPDSSPTGVVRCAGEDAWVAVEVTDAAAWAGLGRVLGRDWPHADLAARRRCAAEALAALGAWAAGLTPDAAATALQAQGVPAAPVRPAHLLADDPQLQATGFWTWAERAHVGRHLHAAPPFRLDGARPTLRRPAPLLGEHTAEVLGPAEAAPT